MSNLYDEPTGRKYVEIGDIVVVSPIFLNKQVFMITQIVRIEEGLILTTEITAVDLRDVNDFMINRCVADMTIKYLAHDISMCYGIAKYDLNMADISVVGNYSDKLKEQMFLDWMV